MGVVCNLKEEEGPPGVASDGSKGGNSLDAVTPGLTLGTLYSSGVGINTTKQHASVQGASGNTEGREGLGRNSKTRRLLPIFDSPMTSHIAALDPALPGLTAIGSLLHEGSWASCYAATGKRNW